MSGYIYIYVVDRDFGFAPNPFHGYCTLATCMAGVRQGASVNDWVMGVGGGRLKATGKCIYLMKVSEVLTYDEYWLDARFQTKKAFRNGSSAMMVGDNIYHKDERSGNWTQEDSHHSNTDGTTNFVNLEKDTRSTQILISNHFYYFGSEAIQVDLSSIGYKNQRNYRKMKLSDLATQQFIDNIERANKGNKNLVLADPFYFSKAHKRVDQGSSKIL